MASPGSVALDLNANEYLSSIAFALLYYDYTLTFEIEVDRFWTPKFTSASYLFYLNRYLGIFGHIPVILQLFRAFSNKTLVISSCLAAGPERFPRCIQLQSYHQILSVVVQVVVGTCLIVRTYALYERARWVLWFLCSLALGVIAVGCWAITGKHTNPVPIQDIGCNTTLSSEQVIRKSSDIPQLPETRCRSPIPDLAIAWGGMTTFDLVIFFLTILKSLRMARIGRRTLVDVILQDGAMYFW
ncbi:hypothetical protein GLOTRDRAFT_133818 [Gloeophyllum trabeum ATCC 11539]|uniref:DUF6533 domain-containing protein n=1 Tax=Gloeophyllum trabeum (strain ATCC 11539 / FP-39264 / Madison 617) TaxID=670483 RepID=S7PSC7_GLOTA|nr:uncharacterized protein GLOTRDRAFT_133818 [Gloeophyllum trabeum ATCC 11539]EPQ50716.1 hypothetical protein GLOTRDRAFT_133818 [Gloeophyllum trabeum ATCC 11539]